MGGLNHYSLAITVNITVMNTCFKVCKLQSPQINTFLKLFSVNLILENNHRQHAHNHKHKFTHTHTHTRVDTHLYRIHKTSLSLEPRNDTQSTTYVPQHTPVIPSTCYKYLSCEANQSKDVRLCIKHFYSPQMPP